MQKYIIGESSRRQRTEYPYLRNIQKTSLLPHKPAKATPRKILYREGCGHANQHHQIPHLTSSEDHPKHERNRRTPPPPQCAPVSLSCTHTHTHNQHPIPNQSRKQPSPISSHHHPPLLKPPILRRAVLAKRTTSATLIYIYFLNNCA